MRAPLIVSSLAALATLAFVFAAEAGDAFATYYGNTIIAKNAKGDTERRSLAADHTFVGANTDGTPVKGTWQMKGGDQICYTVTEPAPKAGQANPTCTAFAPHKIGDTWTENRGGESWSVTLQTGGK
jgi:hypothetical protein